MKKIQKNNRLAAGALTQATICAASILLAAPFCLRAGDGKTLSPAEKTPVIEKKETNPLSFFDGKVVFDVEERLRYEFRENNFDFDGGVNAPNDDSFLLQRARIGLKLSPLPWLRAYGQLQSSIEVGNRGDQPGVFGAEGDDNIDLYQAWIEVANYKDFPLGLKFGRQLFNYGEQRLVGSFDWNNLGRTFDAARLRFEREKLWVEAFVSSVVVVERDEFNYSDLFDWSGTGREQVFSGLYASTQLVPMHTIDAYLLWLNQQNGNVSNFGPLLGIPPAGSQGGNPAFGQNFATFGTRFNNDPKAMDGWEYDVELAFQVGELAGLDLATFAAHVGAGYNLDAAWKPRLYLQYNYASGDGNPSDGRSTTFQNLFPTNHKFYGYMDLFSWQNIHNPSATLSVKPHSTLTVATDFHLFWLATTDDAWYRANGLTRARPITPDASSYVGSELDISFTWKPLKYLTFHGGYSHFFPGDYVRDTGPSSGADFVYVQAELKF